MRISGVGVVTTLMILLGSAGTAEAVSGGVASVYAPIGARTTAPIGYVQFCKAQPADCGQATSDARDVVLSAQALRDLKAINDRVNALIEPVTDADLYGRAEYWTYPRAGKGDCEDYVLLKRRLLIEAGWPASALLITVVRDRKGDGHAVLMVKTDKGELVLDNQETEIRDWRQTGYRYVKRQSQRDPNLWVSLGDTQTTPTVAAR